MTIRKIAVNTGGGDAPGLNAVIRAVALSARRRGWEVSGILRGYEGLLDTEQILPLDADAVRGIAHKGGTILGTINKGNPFDFPVRGDDGELRAVDRSEEVMENFRRLGLDALIAIGGDGSMRIAHRFTELGMPIVGVPKTIDNDLSGTVRTFGFQTAVDVATEAIGRLHSTAESHRRVMVVEVMGRYAGWIALHAGIAGGADVILIPEIPFDLDAVCAKIEERERNGRHFSIVVAAEGAAPIGGSLSTMGEQEVGREVRIGGLAATLEHVLSERTGKEARSVVLGHLQRGGTPAAYDRLLALRFGAAAVRLVAEEKFSRMVALDPPDVVDIDLKVAIGEMKAVPIEGDTVATARDMGICLGA